MATGTIDVSCTEHDSEVVIIWTERVQPLLPLEDPQLSGASWSPEHLQPARRHHRVRLASRGRHHHVAYEQSPSRSTT